jgi:hypothetical protein
VKWYRGSASREGRGARASEVREQAVLEEGVLDCSLEELREFLEADLIDVHADLEFKESLRRKLWDLVRVRNRLRGRWAGRR